MVGEEGLGWAWDGAEFVGGIYLLRMIMGVFSTNTHGRGWVHGLHW